MRELLEPIRVLLVDDHQMVTQSLRVVLELEPDIVVVATAGSMADAIVAAEVHRPDVILMDHHLPDGDGLTAAAHVVAKDPGTKIILLTGSDDPHAVSRAVAAGCVGYLDKVASIEDLAAAVRAAHAGRVVISAEQLAQLLPGASGPTALTKREREILYLVADGRTNKAIAAQLVLSVHTVRTHVQTILAKLGAHSKLEAVAIAKRRRLLG